MPDVLVSNERCKAVSNLFFTLCAGLVAGSAVRTWEGAGPDIAVLEWLLVAMALAWFGWMTLGLIVPEDRI
ncbi:MAG TPA: hypothetical protein VFZ88_11215 [Sphingomicrobium sp.]